MTKLLLCSCAGTQAPDPAAIEAATGLACSRLHSALCVDEAAAAAEAIREGDVIVACGQEAAFFEALAAEAGAAAPLAVDIRDRAGWSADEADKTPKIAALLALARLEPPARKTMGVISDGVCLILGPANVGADAAARLADVLAVTCVSPDAPDLAPGRARPFDAHQGRVRSATGTLGRFEVVFDGFAEASPAGRGALGFAPARDGARSSCDLILDLSGGAPLFPAPEKRDGYLRADPRDPLAVARAVFDAAQMVGEFEKPLYIAFDESLCAHSRAQKTGCTRCLDLCPTGAITPAGDAVAIDPNICAGCGACAAACPSGAASFDDPPATHVFARTRALAAAYRGAGGDAPRLLVHDADHGAEMIALSARLGRGLPADVVPLEVEALASFGHAEALVALANGCAGVDMLVGPKADRDAIAAQVELASAMVGGLGLDGARVRMIEPADPDALSDLLFAPPPAPHGAAPVMALGGRREAARMAAKSLAEATSELAPAIVDLPAGAPYGAVLVDAEACTLCLACASLCPSGALTDNPDKPQLLFQEDACLQCSLCVSVCPETAITLKPRLNIGDDAFSQKVMREEEPYACIECGKLFGVKSTIERIVEKLEGKHSMFTNSDNAKLIRMCDDCRVGAQFHSDDAPFFAGHRPRVRTSDDYRNGGGEED